jgi:hypothetical protein
LPEPPQDGLQPQPVELQMTRVELMFVLMTTLAAPPPLPDGGIMVDRIRGPKVSRGVAAARFDFTRPGGRLGLHGMVVLPGPGESALLSHIPMFHPPHDIQALFQVRLPGGLPPGGQYTLKPGTFALDDLLEGRLRTVPGTLYRGNFETGGEPLREVVLTVERVVMGSALSEGAQIAPALEYLLIGTPERAFAVHRLSGPPGFDHQVEIDPGGTGLTREALAQGVWVSFPGKANTPEERLAPGKANAVLKGGRTLSLQVLREISALQGPDFVQPL